MLPLELAFAHGTMGPLKDALIPLTDRGLLFGQMVFETLLVRNGRPLFWPEHWKRITHNSASLGFSHPPEGEVWQAVQNLLSKAWPLQNLQGQQSLRVMFTAGCQETFPLASQTTPHFFLFCRNISSRVPFVQQGSLQLHLQEDLRSAFLSQLKTNAYALNCLALEKARAQGYDDALFVNPEGDLIESTTSNLLWIDAAQNVCIAPENAACLPGITQAVICAEFKKQGGTVLHKTLNAKRLNEARAAFLVSSLRGLTPIARIENAKFSQQECMQWGSRLNDLLEGCIQPLIS
jgi:branched-subunit amino acid aminotransferase/4-amino-4-deoxychorismate lyase